MPPCHLAGKGVLVTRPAAQAAGLCRLIADAGGRPIAFPAIAIRPPRDLEPARRRLGEPWDLLVFVSRNAVEQSLPLFPGGRIPSQPRLAAVGRATAKALASAGRNPDLVPVGRYDSETLLALVELQDLQGQRVLIVRGSGGRALLGDVLTERGAALVYADVYRRALPNADPAPLLKRWGQDVDLVTATSGEVLHNLITLLGTRGRDRLLATRLVVVSERTRQSALRWGFERVELAERADDLSLLEALCRAASGDA